MRWQIFTLTFFQEEPKRCQVQSFKQDACPDDSIETSWISRKSPMIDVCTAMRSIDGTDFYQKYLLKVNFESKAFLFSKDNVFQMWWGIDSSSLQKETVQLVILSLRTDQKQKWEGLMENRDRRGKTMWKLDTGRRITWPFMRSSWSHGGLTTRDFPSHGALLIVRLATGSSSSR